jgi:hypothetical protein
MSMDFQDYRWPLLVAGTALSLASILFERRRK